MKNTPAVSYILKNCTAICAILKSVILILLMAAVADTAAEAGDGGAKSFATVSNYRWLETYDAGNSLENRIPPPRGFKRVQAAPGSFAWWLRGLPLKAGRPPVLLYDKRPKSNQNAHYAVIDIDGGPPRDLQQCADAIMRLRGEYFFARGEFDAIKFAVGDGREISYESWLKSRPEGALRKNGRSNFIKYMTHIFAYAGTHSLSKSLQKVGRSDEMRIGDVFIKGGFPGHAVMICDIAENCETGERVFMLLQSYMPAQDVHILKNPSAKGADPWYKEDRTATLHTPEWDFGPDQLMRFR